MLTIHKYELAITDEVSIPMPQGANILCAREQKGKLYLYAEVETHEKPRERVFRIYGTGTPIDLKDYSHLKYIDTVQISPFVWHVYEYIPILGRRFA